MQQKSQSRELTPEQNIKEPLQPTVWAPCSSITAHKAPTVFFFDVNSTCYFFVYPSKREMKTRNAKINWAAINKESDPQGVKH